MDRQDDRAIRVLIADDHAVVREGLRWLISTEPGIDLVGEAADGIETVEKACALQPDVILMDLLMPRKDGVAAIGEIVQLVPSARILVLTSFAEDEKVFSAVKAGALGYLIKDSSPAELMQAIRDVHRGEPSMDPAIAQKLMRELQRSVRQPDLPRTEEPLTEREVEVLKQLAQGLPNQDIADRLTVSERTVRTHVSNILNKLHLANRTQAALYALREGLVDIDVQGEQDS
ncbi:MAG: response regulator transcription factor [Anaerolineae bacterium]|nr:response regulator transcription factor [Anaerolineae bacterium]